MSKFLLVCAPVLMGQTQPPLVPEGIHRDVRGPLELCGFAASDVAALERQISADPAFHEENSNDQYRVFNRQSDFVQFVFPRPLTLRFSMATCRKLISETDGTHIEREMHCDGLRGECDRIYLEFEALDAGLQRALGGNERG